MKRIIAIWLLVCVWSLNLHAQKMPADYYEEGHDALTKGEYKKAIKELSFLTLSYPGDAHYHNSLCELSNAYFKSGMYDSATRICKQIITDTPIVPGRDFVSDRCAQCKHCRDYNGDADKENLKRRKADFNRDRKYAEVLLYQIYKTTEVYDSALKYLYRYDTVNYPYGYEAAYCGFGKNYSREFYLNTLKYADLFELMGRYKESEQTLILASFLWREDSTLKKLSAMLARHENIKELQNQLQLAVQHWQTTTNNAYLLPLYYKAPGPYIDFFGTRLTFCFAHTYDYNPYKPEEAMLNQDGSIDQEKIARNYFYKWFMSLKQDGSYPPVPKQGD